MAYSLAFDLYTTAGLADLRAQLVDTTGASVGAAVSTGFVEIGTNGMYLWYYAGIPDGHVGGVKFYSNAASTNILGFRSINPQEAEYNDAKTSTRATPAQVNTEADTALLDVGLTATITGRIDATVSSRATPAQVATELGTYDAPTKAELDSAVAPLATAAALTIVDDFLDTEIAAIKAKTDNLPPDPADASDITAAVATLATAANLATLAGYVDTEVAAIKAKTDNLPADTSAVLNTIDDLLDTEIGAIQSSIAALNNLSSAQAETAAAAALATYDAPTFAELDARTDAIDAAIAALNDLSVADLAGLATAANLDTVASGVAAILDDTGTSGVVISTSVMQSLADVILGRSVATVEGTASTHSLAEMILGLLESTTAGTVWTIKKTDGSTTFNTRTLTLDEDALPITGVA